MSFCDTCGYTDVRKPGTRCPVPDCGGEMTGADHPVDVILDVDDPGGTSSADRSLVETECGPTAVEHAIKRGDIYAVGDELRVTSNRRRLPREDTDA